MVAAKIRVPLRRLLGTAGITLLSVSACVGTTIVGEVLPAPRDAAEQMDADGAAVELRVGSDDDGARTAKAGSASPLPDQILLQPSSGKGEDFSLSTLSGAGLPVNPTSEDFGAEATTIDGALMVRRGLIRFRVPLPLQTAQVRQAQLSLRHNPDRVAHTVGTAWRIGRALGIWDSTAVSWVNQPQESSDALFPPRPVSSNADFQIDVTGFVRDAMAAREAPAFVVRLVDETTVPQRLLFCSSDHSFSSCHPTLLLLFSPQTQ